MDSEHPAETPAGATVRETGPQIIQRYLKHLGSGPGVYRMLDLKGDVIYVGKARNLKARVQNYARLAGHGSRIARMISTTAAMEFVSTATESEALLLEANLIKRFRPTFNVTMRDDKSFPYILISREHPAPQIMKHRGSRNIRGDYFGPFASAGAVNRTLNMLQRAFLLRSCSDAMFESRTRPCLLYQIKRCSGPCTREIEWDAYGKLVDEAVRFLEGKTDAVQKKLNALMEEASEALEFERAARYRDRLWALAHVQATQGINPRGVEEADVFAAYQEGGQTCIQVFFFRAGQNWGNRAYFPRADRSLGLEEVLESFIAQFYDDKPVARCVFISHDFRERALLTEALSIKAGRKVEVTLPKRGEKASLVAHALQNAREALGRKLAEASSQAKLLAGVATAFGLPKAPERIEVYDNSHIQGSSAVGAMIVAGPEGFVKKQYRKFNIKSETLTPGDDFAMMREMLLRRFTRLAKERAAGQAEACGDPGLADGAVEGAEPEAADLAAASAGAESVDPGAGARGRNGVDAEAAAGVAPLASRPLTQRSAPSAAASAEGHSAPMTEVVALSRASGESRGPGLAEAPSAFRQSRDVALSAGRPSPLAGAEGAEGAAEAGPGEGGLRPGTGGADPGDDIPEEVASWEGISPDGALGLTDEGEDSIGAPDDLAKATSWGCPDLVLIDGGPGQLSAAHEVLDALGIGDIILVGIAKGPDRNAGREHFYMRGRRPFMLEPRDPVLYFVQRLRDEAHRFAIGTHRAKRAKAIAANPLDEIPGIGAKRRRALLKHFGSAKAISRAGVEDLQAVDGISAAMAQTIYDHFRGAGG